tara:strand:+ start:1102 stop:1518 length:417 start_codon:yes stop_codon:yes gene_type:complete
MPKLSWTAAIAFGVCAAFTGAPALAESQTSAEHHSNYWLLIHTSSTEPPEEMREEAFAKSVLDVYGLTPQTMDDASITTKLAVIERMKATFSEGESIALKALPMPSLDVCNAAGDLATERLTIPSMMTISRYICIPGR